MTISQCKARKKGEKVEGKKEGRRGRRKSLKKNNYSLGEKGRKCLSASHEAPPTDRRKFCVKYL